MNLNRAQAVVSYLKHALIALALLSTFSNICVAADILVAVIADPQIGITSVSSDTTELRRTVVAIQAGHNGQLADLLLILGDLSDESEFDGNLLRYCKDIIDDAGITTLWVAGNHDFFSTVEHDTCVSQMDSVETIWGYPPATATAGDDSVWYYDVNAFWRIAGVNTGCQESSGDFASKFNFTYKLDELSPIVLGTDRRMILASHYPPFSTPNRSGEIAGGTDNPDDVEAAMDSTRNASWRNPIVIAGHRNGYASIWSDDGKGKETINEIIIGNTFNIGDLKGMWMILRDDKTWDRAYIIASP